MDSYDVRFWDIKKLGNGSTARFRVRWAVDGREHCKSFKARPLADGFLDGPQGRGPRPAALQPPHRPARSRDHRGGDDHLVRPRPRLHRGQVAEPGPGLPPVGRRGPGHRHHRPHREGAGRARAEGAAAGAVRLGVQPRHPRHRPAARDRRRPRLGRTRLAARRRAGRHGHRAARAGRLRPQPHREAGGRVDAAAQAVGVLQRPRLRRRAGPPALQPGRPHPVDHPRRRPDAWTGGSWSAPPRPGPAGRRPGPVRPGRAPGSVLRLPVLRRAAPLGGRHAPRERPAPAEEGLGKDRPGRLRLPRRARPGPTTAPPARNAA